MKSWILIVLGVLLTLAGIVWILQGLGVMPGGAMSGVTFWAIVGVIVAIVGIILLVLGLRARMRKPVTANAMASAAPAKSGSGAAAKSASSTSVSAKSGAAALTFTIKADKGGQFSWWLFEGDDQLCWAGESFASKSNAKRSATAFKNGASAAKYEVYEAGAKWRWRAIRAGEKVAASGDSPSKAVATAEADKVRLNAASATIA